MYSMSPTDIICISIDADFHKESKYVFFFEKKYLYHHEKCIHKSLWFTMVVVVHHGFLLVPVPAISFIISNLTNVDDETAC